MTGGNARIALAAYWMIVASFGSILIAADAPDSPPPHEKAEDFNEPESRNAPPLLEAKEVIALPAPEAYEEGVRWLSAGKQFEAEAIFTALNEKYPANQAIAFAHAVCDRSRFDVDVSLPLLQKAASLNPDSSMGQAAGLMHEIDLGRDKEGNFAKMMALVKGERADPLIMWMGGIAARTMNNNAAGEDCYRRMLVLLDPGPVLAHQTFANLLTAQQKYDEALVHRRIAVQMEPSGWSYQGLALTLGGMKRYKEADDAYAEALKDAPENWGYWETWGSMLYAWQHYDNAIVKCGKTLEINPNDVQAIFIWGLALKAQGKVEDALDKFRSAVKIEPKAANVYSAIADTLLEHALVSEEALASRRKAAELQPTVWNYLRLAYLCCNMDHPDEANAAYANALKLEPKSTRVLTDWALGLVNQERYDDAAAKCKQALAIDPACGAAYAALGACYAAQKKPDEALAMVKKGIEVSPNDPQRYRDLGNLLMEQGKEADAKTAYLKAKEVEAKTNK